MSIAMAMALVLTVPVIGAVVIPLAWMIMHHKRKMEELRQKSERLMAAEIQGEFDKLRSEIRDLRDVAMQYDLSFDTALQQMERRVAHLEKPHYSHPAHEQPAENVLRSTGV